MSKFTVAIGDWSDDGHGKYDEFIVAVPDEFTQDILGANFAKNVTDFGFSPEDFANEYEDSNIPSEYLDALFACGLPALEEEDEQGDYESHVTVKDMLNITMLFFGYNLQNFKWKLVNDEAPALIGNGSTVTNVSGIGYGLYI